MEQLKVKKKDRIIMNVLIYLGLSFFFLYIQHAYRHHLSPFSLVYLRKGLELFWYVVVTLLISGALIWKHHKYSLIGYGLSIFLIGFKVIEGLFIEFNKMIVIATFFYAIISYFLYQLLKYYLNLASINPNYSDNDLFSPLLRPIDCAIKTGSEEYTGILTNWDQEGCFIQLKEGHEVPAAVQVKVSFRDREFIQEGEVVALSLDNTGVGIKFEKTTKELNVFNWTEFMEIVEELGYEPERLR